VRGGFLVFGRGARGSNGAKGSRVFIQSDKFSCTPSTPLTLCTPIPIQTNHPPLCHSCNTCHTCRPPPPTVPFKPNDSVGEYLRIMAHIFLDESGDLGFKKESSRWFLFTIAIVKNPRALDKVVKKIWRPLKKKYKKLGELHAYHADKTTRLRLLKSISEITDLKVLSVILNKEKVYTDLQNQKNYLYNYTANILLDRLSKKDFFKPDEPFYLVIDKKDSKKIIKENFLNYLSGSMVKKLEGKLDIQLCSSHDHKSLQAVDFISWAIFRKYEKSDFEYYEIIKNKIVDEKLLFP